MAQRRRSNSLAGHAYRRGRPWRSSLPNQNSPASSPVSFQESDSSSEYDTAPSTSSPSRTSTPPTRPPTRLPTPSDKSEKKRQYIPFSQRLAICNITRSVPSSDDDAGPSGRRATAEDKGKEPEVYEGSEGSESIATRLNRMEGKLDLLLPLLNEIPSHEKQTFHEDQPEPVTEEQIQSSQTYQKLKADNGGLEAKLETARSELQALKALADPEVNKRKGREINDLEMTPDNYQYVIIGWIRALDFREGGWTMANSYKEEKIILEKEIRELKNRETIFLKHICELRDANKDLSKRIEAYELENIVRNLTDCTSRTQPQVKPRSNTGLIGGHPDTKEEMQLYEKGDVDLTGIQDDEEDQQERLEEGLEQNQEKAPQAEQGEQQDGELKDEPAVQPELREPYEGRSQEFQEEPLEKPQEGQRESEEDGEEETRSLDKKIARGEEKLKELTSTTQELATGGHTEPELPEQQDMVETTIGNDQPAVEAQEEQSPSETQDVVVVDTAPKPDTSEPVDSPDSRPITSTERRPKKDRRRHGKHRHRRQEDRDHHKNREHHRDRDERHHHQPSHRSDRRNTEHRIQRRQQQGSVPYWIGSPSWTKTYFGTGLRDLIRSLKIRMRG